MLILSIDGACRRNGKPDCLSTCSVFIKNDNDMGILLGDERYSTNQRGELAGLNTSLKYALSAFKHGIADEAYLVTDSEYLFNSIKNKWYENWIRKGWVTSTGGQVKNQEMWATAAALLGEIELAGFEVIPYHVKGHFMPFGKVAAKKLIESPDAPAKVYEGVKRKLALEWLNRGERVVEYLDVFERNHGHQPPMEVFKELISCNMVADLYASYHADVTDAAWARK